MNAGGRELTCGRATRDRRLRADASAVVKAAPAELKFLLDNAKSREYFDPMCHNAEVIQTIDETSSIMYFLNRKLLVVRDFCVLRHERTTVRRASAEWRGRRRRSTDARASRCGASTSMRQSEGHVYFASTSVQTPLCPPRGTPIPPGRGGRQQGSWHALTAT